MSLMMISSVKGDKSINRKIFTQTNNKMKISVIGTGAMGGAIIEGLLKSGAFSPSDIMASNPHTDKLRPLEAQGVIVTSDNNEATMHGDIVIIAVKPWLAEKVIKEIAPRLDNDRQTIVSVAAGISTAQISSWTEKDGHSPSIFLAIPNTAAATCCSMTFVSTADAAAEDKAAVKLMFDTIGETIFIEESQLPAATMLASCGIAYALRYIRAATEGGVELGFKASLASRIVAQTVKGAASLLMANNSHPEVEIDKVTTAGGITIKGLNEMEHAGFTSAVIRGLKAGLK